MIVGSDPETAVATTRPRGVSPRSVPTCSLPSTTRAAPSTIPEELPPWCTWLMRSTSGTSPGDRVEAGLPEPCERRLESGEGLDGGAGAEMLVAVEHYGAVAVDDRDDAAVEPSVRLSFGGSGLGLGGERIDVLAAPTFQCRNEVGADALRNEAGGQVGLGGSLAQAPPSELIGTRDMLSTPPAKTMRSHPEAIFWAAVLTASSPEAQKRFSCTPATVSGKPAARTAVRAMSAPDRAA